MDSLPIQISLLFKNNFFSLEKLIRSSIIKYLSLLLKHYTITQLLTMIPQKEPSSTNKRGYYIKQIAAINNQSHEFRRNKKGIKKQNKNICREARQNKKIYIESLEKIKASQQAEINSLKAEVSNLREKLQQKPISMESSTDAGIKELIGEYKQLINSINIKDETLIKRSLAVLRSRFGIAGRDRMKWIQQHLLRIIELSMPMHFRVLLQNCDNSKTFFSLLSGGEDMKFHRVNFSEQKKQILKEMKLKIKTAKEQYNRIYEKIYSSWMELKKYGEESQKIIDQIEDKVNHPIFIGNLLMSLDHHRSRDTNIRQVYPINFFKSLKQNQGRIKKYQQIVIRQNQYFEQEDRQAFDLLFNDYSDFH